MPSVLIIGAGARVGRSVADKFAQAGYTVALASRTAPKDVTYKHFVFDASDPTGSGALFSKVREAIGIPTTVVYNAAAAHMNEDPFGNSLAVVESDMRVNAITPYEIAHEAVKGFEALGDEKLGVNGGTFIFTGNILNVTAGHKFMAFGMGKAAASHMVQSLALAEYHGKPYQSVSLTLFPAVNPWPALIWAWPTDSCRRFYFCDQRKENGDPLPTGLSGPAHADLYIDLAQDPTQRPWRQTFVEGRGYVKFDEKEVWVA